MYSEDAVLDLIELIYSAAADPARWAELLELLSRILKGSSGTIHHQHLNSHESNIAVTWNLDPAAMEQYAAYYGPLNVWFTTRPELNTQGNVYTSQMLCPEELLARTEFYNDWAAPFGMHQGGGATVLKIGPVSTNISIFRPKNGTPFGSQDLALLRVLMPHLQRAFQLHNRIQGLETKAQAAAGVLDHIQQGVVLLDGQERVLLVNDAAAALFAGEKALKLTPRGLVAAVPSQNRQLNGLIHGVITTANGNGLHSGGAMTISRGDLRQPLQVLVVPLRAKTIHLGKDVPVVAVFISDPDRKPLSTSTVFAQLFGLTPAEARLATILASGNSLKDAAERLGVAQSTLRSQLKSIFAKTNTSRQNQLVRLMLLTPSRASKESFTRCPGT